MPGAFWWRHDLTAIDRAAAELATLRATITRLEGERDAAADVIKQCRDAFAEEMEAWDLDPPLAHLLKAHDRCETWLARAALQEPKT